MVLPRRRLLALLALSLASLAFLAWWARADGRERGLRPAAGKGRASVGPNVLSEHRLHETEAAADPRREAAEAEPETAEPLPTFRGLVVDASNDEPVGHLRIVAGALHAPVDGEGRFDLGAPLPPEVERLCLHDPFHRTHVRDVALETLLPIEEGWLARIAIGPTYHLRIEAPDGEEDGWSARLVEEGVDGSVTRGSWQRLGTGARRFLRYDNPWEPNLPGSRFQVEAIDRARLRSGASPVFGVPLGVHRPRLVDVRLRRELARLSGRAVDVSGGPLAGADVRADPLARDVQAWSRSTTWTGDDGRFELAGLEAGAWRIGLRPPRGAEPQGRRVVLTPGENELEDFVFEHADVAGDVEGRIELAGGAPAPELVFVRLRALDGRDFERVERVDFRWIDSFHERLARTGMRPGPRRLGDLERAGLDFEFDDLPPGEYELVPVAGGASFDPPSMRVAPPAEELVFTVIDAGARFPWLVELRAAADGAPLEGRVWACFDGFWTDERRASEGLARLGELPPDARFTWLASAPDHRPARGDASAFVASGGERRARIALGRGWGALLFVRELADGHAPDDDAWQIPDGRGVAGARALLDGEPAASSDARGVLLLEAPAAPGELELRASGWRALEPPAELAARARGSAPLVVWMLRE